jgi:hypothetical protein
LQWQNYSGGKPRHRSYKHLSAALTYPRAHAILGSFRHTPIDYSDLTGLQKVFLYSTDSFCNCPLSVFPRPSRRLLLPIGAVWFRAISNSISVLYIQVPTSVLPSKGISKGVRRKIVKSTKHLLIMLPATPEATQTSSALLKVLGDKDGVASVSAWAVVLLGIVLYSPKTLS